MCGRQLVSVVLVGLVLIAGCSMPMVGSIGSAEVNESDVTADVETADDLSVDTDATFERTEAVLDVEGEKPDVAVENLEPLLEAYYEEVTADPFYETLNLTEVAVDTENTRGVAYGPSEVAVDPNEGSDAMIERVLVHEYVHALQNQKSVSPPEPIETTDDAFVWTALYEGGAVWATDRYVDEHHEERSYQRDRMAEEYRAGPPGDRYFRAPYYFGATYVERTVDDADDFWTMYEDVPESSSAVLHEAPATEVPVEFSKTVEDDVDSWSEVAIGPDDAPGDRKGEVVVRVALEGVLPSTIAADAAEGWTNDELRTFAVDDDYGHVWTLTWQEAADAEAFRAAFDRSLDERTDDHADDIEIVPVDDRTVTIVAGPQTFRDAVAVSGGDRAVTVTIAETEASTPVVRTPAPIPG